MNWKHRLEQAFRSHPLDHDIVEELSQHAAATYAAARADGFDAAEAEHRVELQIAAWAANPALLRRRASRVAPPTPPGGRANPLAALLQDARYTWRLLRQQPA